MKNIKKSLRSVFCALLAAAALAASLPAYAVSQAEIDDLQKKLDALEQQAQEQQDVINDLTSQKARFITRKLALDNKIEINRQMIELIGEQIEIYDEIIAEKQADLDKALEKETAQTELLRSRIRAMEENSTYSYASFIFDSSSVTELLSRIGDVNDIMHYDKTLEEEYMAAREDVESIKKSYEEARHEGFRVAVSRSHQTPETAEHIRMLRQARPDLKIVEQGSSYKFCLLAEGIVDYYVRTSPTYEWDTAAGELILSEAGGETRSLPDNRPFAYNKTDLHNPWFVCRSRDCAL